MDDYDKATLAASRLALYRRGFPLDDPALVELEQAIKNIILILQDDSILELATRELRRIHSDLRSMRNFRDLPRCSPSSSPEAKEAP